MSFNPTLVSLEKVGEGQWAWRVRYAGVDVSDGRAEFYSLLFNRRVCLSESAWRHMKDRCHRGPDAQMTPEQAIAHDVKDWWDGLPAHRCLEMLSQAADNGPVR